jgi:RHS repeat-associated protein
MVKSLRRLFSFRQLSALLLGLLTAAVAVSASAQDPFSVAASRAYRGDLRSFGIQQHRPRSVRGLPVAPQAQVNPASSSGLVFYFPTVTVPDNSVTTFNIEWSCYTLSGPVPDVVSGQYGSVNPSGQGVTLTNIPSSEPVGQWFSVDAVVSSAAPAGQYGIGVFGNGEAQYDQYCGSNGLYSAAGIMNVLGSRDNLGCRDCDAGNQPMVGDPINVTAANLYEDEIDFRSPIGTLPLEINRHFNSSNQIIGLFGDDWTSNFDVALFGNQSAATARLPDGQEIGFTNNGSGWVPQTSVPATLTTNASGYLLVKTDTKDQYQFNSSGQIISQTNVRGETLIYTRNPSNTFEISSVSDNYGNSMSFTYYTYTTAGGSSIYLVHTATVMGQTYTYTYDPNYFNLTAVSYTLNVNGTNKTVSRQYQYNAADPYQLTGIVDENGNTVANFAYDGNDLPYYSDAGGTESMTADYTNLFSTNPSVTVTNANGYQQIYSLAHNNDGTAYVDTIAGQVSGNQNVTPATTYTVDNGQDLPQVVIDGNGYGTQYAYDPVRAILTQKTSGYQWDGVSFISSTGSVGSPNLNETGAMSKMQVTQLDPVFPYPDRIEYFGKNPQGQWVNTKQVDAGYDSVNGRLTSWKETDLTGNASPGSSPRTTTYSYTYYDGAKTKLKQELIYGPRYASEGVNDVTELDYDSSGRLTTKKDGSNHSWTYASFTSTGLPTQITDNQNGTVTTISYDQKNRPQLITLASNTAQWEVEQLVYYPNGMLQETIRPDGSYLQYAYDNAGHLNQITDSAGNVVTLTPSNLDGQWTSLSIANTSGATVQAASRAFDDIGRLLSATGNFGTQTTKTYDLNNNLQTSYQNGDQTTQLTRVYDALNRVQQLQHPPVGGGSPTTPYETNTYDATGALTKVTDPRNLSTAYTVDGLGDVVAQTSPDTGPATMVHDAAGNLIQRTDNKGQVVKYAYDAINRLTSIVSVVNGTGTTLATYTYDQTDHCGQLTATHGCGYGRLTSMTDGSGTTDFAYDGIGHLLRKTQVTNGVTLITSYSYYADTDDVQTMTLPSGTKIGYTWDNNGHISAMTLTPAGSTTATNLVTSIKYQPFNGPLTWTLGNGEKVGRNYDLDGAVSGDPIDSQIDYSADKQALQDVTLGGGSSFSASTVTYSGYRSFTYDNFFHVTGLSGSVAIGGKNPKTLALTYGSDSADNRLTYVNGSKTTNYTPSTTSNQLASSKKGFATTHYYYDLNGNFTGTSSTAPTNTYDALNRLIQYASGKTTATYAYNGHSERVLKTVGTTTTLFAYDEAGHLIGEYNGSTPVEETVWLGDMPVAIQEPSGTYYVHADYRNVPRQIDNAKKQVVWAWDPYVFGDTSPDQNPPGTPFSKFVYNLRFPGQYYDSETGFFYNMNRYFDPATGRYTSVDPLGLLAGVNPYIYVLNNPLSYIDPFGLDPWTLITSPFRRDGGIPEQDLIGLENDFSAIEGAATTAAAVGPYALTVAGSAVGEAGGMVCRAATPKNTRSLFTALRMFERLYGGPEIETELSEMSQEMAEQRLLPGGKLNPTPPPPPSPPNIGGP